ncbi:MAG: hypothetical protein J6K89_05270 [Oscillospiraceae bacterium]|nr:hypothetical protein [Oscillospiraceae bacterium]
MKKYIVISESTNPNRGDMFTSTFDSKEAANNEAEELWNHLTHSEKQRNHIYVEAVTEECLLPVEEGEELDWTAFDYTLFEEGCFDSRNIPVADEEDDDE